MNKNLKEKSKHISKLLRHEPENLEMNESGYVLVSELLNKLNITLTELKEIVSENDKQRFSFNEDETKIRANQGHSITVELNFKKVIDDTIVLYHGTSINNLESIKTKGLIPMKRNYVHLTDNIETAKTVGLRYAKQLSNLIVLAVTTKDLIENNIEIFISENGVYQVKQISYNLLNIEN